MIEQYLPDLVSEYIQSGLEVYCQYSPSATGSLSQNDLLRDFEMQELRATISTTVELFSGAKPKDDRRLVNRTPATQGDKPDNLGTRAWLLFLDLHLGISPGVLVP